MQILVLGMHRSGTSSTTRIINMMGAYIGSANSLLPANDDNAKGFWERKDVMQVNEGLLKHQACSWFNVANWADAPAPPATADKIKHIINELNNHSPWVLKDPRLCITLPNWLPFLNHPVAIIATRHPLECARSLARRNNIPEAHGLALWEYHAVGILRNAADLPKIFSHYDDLLNNPTMEAQRLCDELEEYVPALCLPNPQEVTGFITPALKRATTEGNEQLTPHHQHLYDMLCGTAEWDKHIRISEESQSIMKKFAV